MTPREHALIGAMWLAVHATTDSERTEHLATMRRLLRY